jgi:uncharacterized alkaline shock family protein YloU
VTELVRTAEGEIAISPSALQQIVVHAAESVDGVRVRRPRRALEVQIERNRCRVELQVGALYGTQLAEAAEAVQERVAEALQRMCEVAVDAVDVSIEELDT